MAAAKKVALITGITGQDGSYLAELLLAKGYKVHGVVRARKDDPDGYASENIANIKNHPDLMLHGSNIVDAKQMADIFNYVRPDEVYHLAAQSNTVISFNNEWTTFETNTRSTVVLLSLIRDYKPDARFYLAASSELFGDAIESPQNELTAFNPNSPYGISKVASFNITKLYREKHSLFACSGICFSHESPRRAKTFVTRKITSTVAEIKFGLANELRLGNLDTRRDWGFSGDFVSAIWSMLQQVEPSDYVIGTGTNHTIREFVEMAFAFVGLDWRDYVVSDPEFYRASETNPWLADIAKANKDLGWRPNVDLKELVAMMMKNDVERVQQYLRNQ
jgi:GDPmannose 4,6-dehydratase